jgi:hypothetical protein
MKYIPCLVLAVLMFLPVACKKSVKTTSPTPAATATPTPISVAGTWNGTIACGGPSALWSGILTQSGETVNASVVTGSTCIYSLVGTISGNSLNLTDSTYNLNLIGTVNNAGTSFITGSYTMTSAPAGCGVCSSAGVITGNR